MIRPLMHESTSLGVCHCASMGVPGITIQPVDEGNSEPTVRFLIEWVSDGEAEARRYLADHADPDGREPYRHGRFRCHRLRR